MLHHGVLVSPHITWTTRSHGLTNSILPRNLHTLLASSHRLLSLSTCLNLTGDPKLRNLLYALPCSIFSCPFILHTCLLGSNFTYNQHLPHFPARFLEAFLVDSHGTIGSGLMFPRLHIKVFPKGSGSLKMEVCVKPATMDTGGITMATH